MEKLDVRSKLILLNATVRSRRWIFLHCHDAHPCTAEPWRNLRGKGIAPVTHFHPHECNNFRPPAANFSMCSTHAIFGSSRNPSLFSSTIVFVSFPSGPAFFCPVQGVKRGEAPVFYTTRFHTQREEASYLDHCTVVEVTQPPP